MNNEYLFRGLSLLHSLCELGARNRVRLQIVALAERLVQHGCCLSELGRLSAQALGSSDVPVLKRLTTTT